MLRAHKIKLNPTIEQEVYFLRASGIARFAWNWSLAEYKRLKADGGKADWNDIKKQFRSRIDADFPFVREVTKCAFEEAISDLRQSIATYYSSKRTNKKLKFPKNRKRSKHIGGFGIANDKFRVDAHAIRIPKLGNINMTEPLRFEGSIRTCRIVEDGSAWYAVIVVDIEKPLSTSTGSIGIDFGLSTFATMSNGEKCKTQASYRSQQRKLRSLSRSLARKQRGSSNYRKAKVRLSKFHRRIQDQRKDYLHKFTSSITARYSVVCIEDLCLKGLCRTRLAKSFYDAGIGTAVGMLAYKAETLQKVDRFYPSTKICSVCGCKNNFLTLSDRTWLCVCGAFHDRDHNAAINIELEGVRLLAGCDYLGVTPVELDASTAAFVPKQAIGCEAGTISLHMIAD